MVSFPISKPIILVGIESNDTVSSLDGLSIESETMKSTWKN